MRKGEQEEEVMVSSEGETTGHKTSRKGKSKGEGGEGKHEGKRGSEERT